MTNSEKFPEKETPIEVPKHIYYLLKDSLNMMKFTDLCIKLDFYRAFVSGLIFHEFYFDISDVPCTLCVDYEKHSKFDVINDVKDDIEFTYEVIFPLRKIIKRYGLKNFALFVVSVTSFPTFPSRRNKRRSFSLRRKTNFEFESEILRKIFTFLIENNQKNYSLEFNKSCNSKSCQL